MKLPFAESADSFGALLAPSFPDHDPDPQPTRERIRPSSASTLIEVFLELGTSDDTEFCHFILGEKLVPVSRGELWRESARFAGLLRESGVQAGEVVLLFLPHSPALLHAFVGAMRAGAVPSILPPPSAKQEPQLYWSSHRQLFARIKGGVLISTDSQLAAIRLHAPDCPLRLLDAASALEHDVHFSSVAAAASDLAFLQHSSGTTGLKKGVALSHHAVLAQIASYAHALRLTPEDRIVSWLPLYHDMGLIACFVLPFITGTPVVYLDPFEWVARPGLLFDAIQRFRGTLCWQPNFAFHHLCRTVRPSPTIDLSSMRAWIDCSEPCRAETMELFHRTFPAGRATAGTTFQACYAMAETVFAVTQTPPGATPRVLAVQPESLVPGRCIQTAGTADPRTLLLSNGPTIPGVQVRIVDEANRPLSAGQVGTISIRGACLFDGYFNLPDETRLRLHDGWYRSSDLGFLHDGELYVTGRAEDLIIVHGRNHYAHQLEFLVNQVAGVHPGRCVAAGWFRPTLGTEEVVIIAEVDALAGTAGLAAAIKQHLLTHTGLLPHDVHLAPPGWLVKTTSGKLSRRENLLKYIAATQAVSTA